MAKSSKKEILIESGTNELEVMEFTIADRHFGINVSKIVEIMRHEKVTPMPNSNPFVEGIFKPRNDIMTLINLASYLGLGPSESEDRDIFIITNFNKNQTAFHVHSVEAIHRISWDAIEKPDPAIYGGEEGMAIGIARIEDRLITIIDFEKILTEISPATSIKISDVDELGKRPDNMKPILVIEDSSTLERMVGESLNRAGYKNLIYCTNGQEAWDLLQKFKATGVGIETRVKCVVTDIEMPLMDGHRLTKLIREDPDLRILPIIIFSSLITPEMELKGQSLGVTDQVSKPDVLTLVRMIDKYIL